MKLKLILGGVAVLSMCLLASGCADEGIRKTTSDNPNISPVLLFTHDGMSVYRFSDAGRYVYYVDGRGRTEWTTAHSTGKSTVIKQHEVETVNE